MKKHVAGTIMHVDHTGASFLVQQSATGYEFYSFPVSAGQTPLGSVLAQLRQTVGLDVEQLRLFDSAMTTIGDERVALFVFNGLQVNEDVQHLLAQHGLKFVVASELHQLFASVQVNTQPLFEHLPK